VTETKWDPNNSLRIDRLGRYNAEKARGLLHNPAWVELMRQEQEAFNEWSREDAIARGCILID
jgi:hypothetical protein